MATSGLYGQSSAGIVSPQSGSESSGLYGNNTVFGGTYFEWFIFQVADVQPATPTGGSWSFTTNSGTPPTGWLASPPANPTNTVWVSVGLVNSKSTAAIEWSAPGKFSFASGLPILSGSSAPASGDGQSDQLYIETGTAPETIWFKQAGTWTRLTGQTLYVDLVNTQSIGGVKTFTQTIQGSISGNAANVTGIVDITHGGTGATTASAARTALGAAASGANSDITSLSGVTGGITTPDYITFDVNPSTVPTAPGSLYWDTADGNQTLSLVMAGGNAIQQIGEEQYYRIKASSAITEGQVVMFTGTVGASGALTGAPASGLTASTASYVMGVATQNIALNGWGYVTSFGLVRQINTNAWTAGTILYYDPAVAGGLTSTIPTAPNAKIQVCAVIYQSASNGSLFIRPSFGGSLGQYEGDVGLTSLASGDVLIRNAGNTVWENKAQSNLIAGNVSGTVAIANGGTGQTTANAAFNALAPSQTGNNGKYLTTDGSNTSWATNPLGTVTSVNASGGTTGLTFSGGPITTNGTLTLSGTLAVANGGTGITSFGTGVATALGTSVGTAGSFVVNGGALGTPSSGTVTNLTGTASININGTVGATTPSTGAFTTLAASSTVTLSGGTANGVAYLNGSKVLTTGSALTFDGTLFTIKGGNASNLKIDNGGQQYTELDFANNGTTKVSAYWDNTNANFFTYTTVAGSMSWGINGSEQMRLTSTGLGIGTSSPNTKLDVLGTPGGTYGEVAYFRTNSAGPVTIRFGDSGTTAATPTIGGNGNDLVFGTGAATQMRLTLAGNLGLGVTPSANTAGKTIQLGAYAAITGTSTSTYIANNWYYSGGDKYINTAAASIYYQNSGSHFWLNAPSGTAGNTISFTQAMTLDASGNLLVGQTYIGSWASGGISLYPNGASSQVLIGHVSGTSSGTVYSSFGYNGSVIGSISQNGTTGVLYNLTSDYRLKNNPVALTGAKDFVMALQPKTWDWWDGSGKGVGFIAHEFMEVAKYSGNGEKDAVDENGNPIYQNIQPSSSEVMANLVAFIQEQQTIIQQLQADVAALKGQA